MADTAVAITAGTGTNIDTRTEGTNGNHRQVVVLGDPATNAGVAPVDATAGLKVDLGADNDVTLATLPDTASGDLAAIKAKTDNIPAQGQALAAASLPVVLTAAQVTTLTPPAAITGFATAAAQTDKSQFTKLTDGTDTALITASGEQNVIATAQPGVDIGDVTINNASGGSAVNIQDGGNSITVDYATTGSGTATGALRVELPTNGTGVIATVGAVTAITNALPAGTNAIGKLAANSGVDIGDVDVTSIAAGTNNIGQVSVAPQTANGLSVFNATSSDGATALTSTAQAIKASAGQVYGWYIYNPNATAQFVQLYNTAAASVTVGTTNPLFMLTIPATSAANVEFTNGITFSNAGFSCAATSTAGGSGAPGTALDAVIFYK